MFSDYDLISLTMLQDFIYILLREFNETILDSWSQSSPATEPPHGMQWCVSMCVHVNSWLINESHVAWDEFVCMHVVCLW